VAGNRLRALRASPEALVIRDYPSVSGTGYCSTPQIKEWVTAAYSPR
jgi:hypothetical protein